MDFTEVSGSGSNGRAAMGRIRRAVRLCSAPVVSSAIAFAFLAAPTFAAPASAATPAGTKILNIATMTSGPAAARTTQPSNTATLTVGELLDVAVAASVPTLPVADAVARVAVPFVITNQGNGGEAYRLAATLSGAGATIGGVALDVDGNGTYDPAVDSAVDATGVATTPGQPRRAFVLVDVPASLAADVTVTLLATAATGSGAAGTVFAGKGDGGGDAVVGATGATARAQTVLHPGAAAPTLVKSQSVVAPDGSARVMAGSVVTYTLEARFPAATPAVEIADAVPAGTTYAAGSLTLDGQPLSDAADTDGGSFDGTAIRVALGDVATAAVRTIRFKTIIQ